MKFLKLFLYLSVGCRAMVLQDAHIVNGATLDNGVSPRSLNINSEFLGKILAEAKKIKKLEKIKIGIENGLAKCSPSKEELASQGASRDPAICIESKEDKDSKEVKTTIIFYSENEITDINLTASSDSLDQNLLKSYFENFLDHINNHSLTQESKLSIIKGVLKSKISIDSLSTKPIDNELESNEFKIHIEHKNPTEADKSQPLNEGDSANKIDCLWNPVTSSLTFYTDYFENTMTFELMTKTEIERELKIAVTDILHQYDRVKRFMYGEPSPKDENQTPQPQHTYTLNCINVFQGNANGQDPRFDPLRFFKTNEAGSQPSPIIKEDNDSENEILLTYKKSNIKIGCNVHSGDSNDGVLILKVQINSEETTDLSALGEITQVFIQKSLYDLIPVVEAFYAEIAWMAEQIYGDSA